MTSLERQLGQVAVESCVQALRTFDEGAWCVVPEAVRDQIRLLSQDMSAAARDGDEARVVSACTDVLGLLEPYRDAA